MSTVTTGGCSMAGSGTRFKPTVPSTRLLGDAYDISMWSVHVHVCCCIPYQILNPCYCGMLHPNLRLVTKLLLLFFSRHPMLMCMHRGASNVLHPILVCMHRGANNVLQGVCGKCQFGQLTKLTSENYILMHVASGRGHRAKVYPSAASRKSLSLVQRAH